MKDFIIAVLLILLLTSIVTVKDCDGSQFIPDTPEKENALVEAIFKAEGSRKASKPYGIMMEKCSWDNVAYCKLAAQQTVRNNIRRWKQANDGRDYLTFLRDRYAPIKNATNDPKGLNHNWKKNVLYFLNNK